jgi:hypothetical protein
MKTRVHSFGIEMPWRGNFVLPPGAGKVRPELAHAAPEAGG